jgi:hypothetical protein
MPTAKANLTTFRPKPTPDYTDVTLPDDIRKKPSGYAKPTAFWT